MRRQTHFSCTSADSRRALYNVLISLLGEPVSSQVGHTQASWGDPSVFAKQIVICLDCPKSHPDFLWEKSVAEIVETILERLPIEYSSLFPGHRKEVLGLPSSVSVFENYVAFHFNDVSATTIWKFLPGYDDRTLVLMSEETVQLFEVLKLDESLRSNITDSHHPWWRVAKSYRTRTPGGRVIEKIPPIPRGYRLVENYTEDRSQDDLFFDGGLQTEWLPVASDGGLYAIDSIYVTPITKEPNTTKEVKNFLTEASCARIIRALLPKGAYPDGAGSAHAATIQGQVHVLANGKVLAPGFTKNDLYHFLRTLGEIPLPKKQLVSITFKEGYGSFFFEDGTYLRRDEQTGKEDTTVKEGDIFRVESERGWIYKPGDVLQAGDVLQVDRIYQVDGIDAKDVWIKRFAPQGEKVDTLYIRKEAFEQYIERGDALRMEYLPFEQVEVDLKVEEDDPKETGEAPPTEEETPTYLSKSEVLQFLQAVGDVFAGGRWFQPTFCRGFSSYEELRQFLQRSDDQILPRKEAITDVSSKDGTDWIDICYEGGVKERWRDGTCLWRWKSIDDPFSTAFEELRRLQDYTIDYDFSLPPEEQQKKMTAFEQIKEAFYDSTKDAGSRNTTRMGLQAIEEVVKKKLGEDHPVSQVLSSDEGVVLARLAVASLATIGVIGMGEKMPKQELADRVSRLLLNVTMDDGMKVYTQRVIPFAMEVLSEVGDKPEVAALIEQVTSDENVTPPSSNGEVKQNDESLILQNEEVPVG